MHVKLIQPAMNLSSAQYFHPVWFNLSLGPASGIVGETVALPLAIQGPLLGVETLIDQ